jgi:hypothetical protein
MDVNVEKIGKKQAMLLKGSPVRGIFKALPWIASLLKFVSRNTTPALKDYTDSIVEMVVWSEEEERTSVMESMLTGAVLDYMVVTKTGKKDDPLSTTLLTTAEIEITDEGLSTTCISGELTMRVDINPEFDSRTVHIPDVQKFVMLAEVGRRVLELSKLVENEDGEKEFDIRADELYAITKREINKLLHV